MVMFWVYTAMFTTVFDLIATHDPLAQIAQMKKQGARHTVARKTGKTSIHTTFSAAIILAAMFFSRMVKGSWEVIKIAPLATLFAYMVGVTLGLPAGYYGGRLDTVLSFAANLILAFPVILLFYLLVTPEIVLTGFAILHGGGFCSYSRWYSCSSCSIPNLRRDLLSDYRSSPLCW